jgi:hypothetical protein
MSIDSEKHTKEKSKTPTEENDTTPSGDAKSGVGEDNRQSRHGDKPAKKKV